MTILEEIAEYTRNRVEEAKKKVPEKELKARCEAFMKTRTADGTGALFGAPHAFRIALRKPGLSIISEVKKASPSKGIISEDFPYLAIARGYEESGADCISCLTEPKWFLGSDDIFRKIRGNVHVPMLRKDFTVDAYQIYEAALMGADAVLLICALLSKEKLSSFLILANILGMDALVEAHDGAEIERAVCCGADIIGVNNRNLKDFSVDFRNAERLRRLIPRGSLFVAESGVRFPEDVAILKASGADAVLVGEALMRSPDRAAMIRAFREVPPADLSGGPGT